MKQRLVPIDLKTLTINAKIAELREVMEPIAVASDGNVLIPTRTSYGTGKVFRIVAGKATVLPQTARCNETRKQTCPGYFGQAAWVE